MGLGSVKKVVFKIELCCKHRGPTHYNSLCFLKRKGGRNIHSELDGNMCQIVEVFYFKRKSMKIKKGGEDRTGTSYYNPKLLHLPAYLLSGTRPLLPQACNQTPSEKAWVTLSLCQWKASSLHLTAHIITKCELSKMVPEFPMFTLKYKRNTCTSTVIL